VIDYLATVRVAVNRGDINLLRTGFLGLLRNGESPLVLSRDALDIIVETCYPLIPAWLRLGERARDPQKLFWLLRVVALAQKNKDVLATARLIDLGIIAVEELSGDLSTCADTIRARAQTTTMKDTRREVVQGLLSLAGESWIAESRRRMLIAAFLIMRRGAWKGVPKTVLDAAKEQRGTIVLVPWYAIGAKSPAFNFAASLVRDVDSAALRTQYGIFEEDYTPDKLLHRGSRLWGVYLDAIRPLTRERWKERDRVPLREAIAKVIH
jgi:hypothetical protein